VVNFINSISNKPHAKMSEQNNTVPSTYFRFRIL